MLRLLLLLLTMGLSVACESQPTTAEEVRRRELPQVRNIRPNVAADRAVLQLQAETIYLRTDTDVSELWSMASSEGIDADRIKLMQANGVRVSTMDAVTLARFYSKLPRTGGSRIQNIGVGHEPVIFETTPAIDRSVDIQAMLGWDRDETLRLPAGRTQMLLDVVISGDKITVGVTPHHHWNELSVTPKSPDEKAMEGRMFKEISFDVDLTSDRYLLLGWVAPQKKEEKPVVPAGPGNAPPAPAPADAPSPGEAPGRDEGRPDVPDVAPAQPAAVEPPASRVRKLGDLLFTGSRADRPLQLLCIIRVPPQGETIASPVVRPEN